MGRKYRKAVSQWTHSGHEILGGKGQILRTKAGGDNWQFRMWVEEEQKYIRKSLKTRDLQTALTLAEKEVLQTLSDVTSGRKIFGITLDEVCTAYLAWRQEDVDLNNITQGRHGTMKSQLKHFISMKSGDLKLSELDRNSYYDYENFRRKIKPDTKKVTIRNEQSTFNHMIAYAYREGYSHFDKLDFRPIAIKGDDIGRRDTFSLKEYDELCRFMRTYVSKKDCPNDIERQERLMIRDCVLFASNTMLRVGEFTQIKWGDIVGTEVTRDDAGLEVNLVTLNVRREITKTRKARQVISRGGEYLRRLQSRSSYTEPNDYIFTEVNGPKQFNKKKLYIHWKRLMDGIKLDYKTRNVTWYSLRHFGITCRIRAGNVLSDIGQIAGTSVSHIESHYGHYDVEMLRKTALKNFTIDKNGISLKD